MQLSIGVSVLCLPWLRWAQPNLPRPIRVNLAWPVIYLIATLFVTIVPMIASPVETGYGLLMIFSSVPVYVVFIAWKNKPKWFQKTMGKCAKLKNIPLKFSLNSFLKKTFQLEMDFFFFLLHIITLISRIYCTSLFSSHLQYFIFFPFLQLFFLSFSHKCTNNKQIRSTERF